MKKINLSSGIRDNSYRRGSSRETHWQEKDEMSLYLMSCSKRICRLKTTVESKYKCWKNLETNPQKWIAVLSQYQTNLINSKPISENTGISDLGRHWLLTLEVKIQLLKHFATLKVANFRQRRTLTSSSTASPGPTTRPSEASSWARISHERVILWP